MRIHMTFDTDQHVCLIFRSLDNAEAFASVHGGTLATRPDAARWFTTWWFPVGVSLAEAKRRLPDGDWWIGQPGSNWSDRIRVD